MIRARIRTRAGIQSNGRLETVSPDGSVGTMPNTSSRTGLQQNSGCAARGLAELHNEAQDHGNHQVVCEHEMG